MKKSSWKVKLANLSQSDKLVTFQDFVKEAESKFGSLKVTAFDKTLQLSNDQVHLILTQSGVWYNVEIRDDLDPVESWEYVIDYIPDAWKEFLHEGYEGLHTGGSIGSPTYVSNGLRLIASLVQNGNMNVRMASRKLKATTVFCGVPPFVFSSLQFLLVSKTAGTKIPDIERKKIEDAVKVLKEKGYGVEMTTVEGRPAVKVFDIKAEMADDYSMLATVNSIRYETKFSIIGWESTRAAGITNDPIEALRNWVSTPAVQNAMGIKPVLPEEATTKPPPIKSDETDDTIPAPPPTHDE